MPNLVGSGIRESMTLESRNAWGIETMRKMILAGMFLAAGAIGANAYEIDPLTRMPLQAPAVVDASRPQASPIPRETVSFYGNYAPGTVVVNTEERRMYFVLGNGQAIRYGVGVGRPGFAWSGTQTVSRKAEWPGWTPPPQMLKRRPDLPRHMAGGPDNPMGARGIYLGSTLYRIHGSNEPETIGQAVSSGCIRMTNEDVIDLYERVRVGTRVVVLR